MLCRDVMNVIEKEYPLNYALSWDNVGLDYQSRRLYFSPSYQTGTAGK